MNRQKHACNFNTWKVEDMSWLLV